MQLEPSPRNCPSTSSLTLPSTTSTVESELKLLPFSVTSTPRISAPWSWVLLTLFLGISHYWFGSSVQRLITTIVFRFKLKFSPDKVDTMIVQAIALLDDLDKEINIYAMRVKEWYGWHFPEMAKIISENITYAKVVKAMGTFLLRMWKSDKS